MAEAGARVVRHSINLGAGAALQTGLQYALLDHSARLFVCFDADGQHRAADAAAMVECVRTSDVEVLIGSRFLGRTKDMPPLRGAVLRGGRLFERFTSGVRLTDGHNGLRVFTRRFAERVDLRMPDMAYATELLSQIARSGLPYGEYPVTIEYSEYSLSKGQRSINSINIALDVWIHQLLRSRSR
jgi:glycosyltransferase involved in cell wall biosynthesis